MYSSNDYDVTSESHSFSFSGFLSGEDFELIGWDGEHMIYESENFKIAVPYNSGSSLYFKDLRRRVDGPSGRRSKWQYLCRR
jgi:hypothetical protein